MISQLTLRFPKDLIEALKARAAAEDASVNALTERLLGEAMQAPAPDEEWRRLILNPDAAAHRLYGRLVLGGEDRSQALTRTQIRYLCMEAHEGYIAAAENELVSRAPLATLLDVTAGLAAWQEESGAAIDGPYLKSCLGLRGEQGWPAEIAALRDALPAAITAGQAEMLCRPLAANCFNLDDLPDAALAAIFSPARLCALFPMLMHAREWTSEEHREFVEDIRPYVPAAQAVVACGSVSLSVRVTGRDPAIPADLWYQAPALQLLVTGRDFVMPFGWEVFAELLRTLAAWRADPDALPRGHQGRLVSFSPPGHTGENGFIGFGDLRVFLEKEGFASFAEEICALAEQGPLAEAIAALRLLNGDI